MSERVELACCTQTLLREIADRSLRRKDIAMTYALALRSSEPTDWKAVNAAIVARWSMAALVWIRKQARSGRCFGAGQREAV